MVALTKRWLPAQRNPSTIVTMGPAFFDMVQYPHLYTCSVCVRAGGCLWSEGLAVVWRLSGGCCSVVRTLTAQARGPEYNSHQLLMTTEAFSRNVSKLKLVSDNLHLCRSQLRKSTSTKLHNLPERLASFPGSSF